MTEKAAQRRGIPSATNVDHIAWTVRDLDETVRFFVDVLGGEEILRAGPFSDPDGEWMATQFDVDPRATAVAALVRLGSTQVVEFLQWTADSQDLNWPINSDVGATHVAIHVTDVEAALEYLVSHGCSPCGEPIHLAGVPHAGMTILYVRTPIGLYLELVSQPDEPMPYEAETKARLLAPAKEWTNL